ncbi:hypothetical protein GQ457_10G014800 [Hibiscus cannabinus]
MSGLKLNTSKSELFASRIPKEGLAVINEVIGFRFGALPVRYLGIPLVTRKLTESDCRMFYNKVREKIRQCSSRNLSFAGRLQLIKSVLMSITNYWCMQLVIPSGILRKIEQLCARFFWKGADTPATGAKVQWQQVCCLKAEGGLGLKDFSTWSKACSFYLIQNILADNGSLWTSMSWTLRKLLKLRGESERYFIYVHTLESLTRGWGVVTSTTCLFCYDGDESHRHLYSLFSVLFCCATVE